MLKLKQSLAAFAGVFVLVGLVTFFAPSRTRGQGNSGNAPPPQNVNVVNTPLPVMDVDNPARQLFSTSRSIILAGDEGAVGAAFPDEVPAGKRLIVEYVTARCSLPQGQRVRLSLGTPADEGLIDPVAFPVTHHIGTFAGSDIYHASESVRLYLPAGRAAIAVVRSQAGGGITCAASLFGHLVDAQQ